MIKNPVYTGIFVNEAELKAKYKPIHTNEFYHHSTIEFKPTDISDFPIGKKIEMKITGRLTTDKVDVLLVENSDAKSKYPHITLSTSNGFKPFESNSEIVTHLDKIQPLQDSIKGVYGVFDGATVHKKDKFDYTVGGL